MAKITIEELSGSLKEYLNGLGLTEAQVQELIDKFEDEKIGDITKLSTEEKGSLVGAINELFQSANNGKELIANAIGEPVSSEDTFQAMSNDINSLLSTFKTNMMNSGVTVNSSDKFKQLIDKIKGLTEGEGNKGIQMVSGIIENLPSGSEPFITVDLNFKAEFIIINSYTDYLGFNNPDESGYLVAYEGGAGLIRGANSIAFYPKGTASGSAVLYDFLTNALFSNCYVNDTGFRLPIYQPYNNSFSKPNNPTDVRYVAIGVGEEDTTLRDSLASILQEEGVSVTEEDDMASLISKVNEEFDRQVVPAGDAVAANVLIGKTFINSTGSTLTGTMANNGTKTITPKASAQSLGAGYYDKITINGDADLVAANIVSGKNIFGVAGSATVSSLGGKSITTGTATGTIYMYQGDDTYTYTLTFNNALTFTPSRFLLYIPKNAKSSSPDSISLHNLVVDSVFHKTKEAYGYTCGICITNVTKTDVTITVRMINVNSKHTVKPTWSFIAIS